MLKQRILAIIAGTILMLAVAGSSGIVADSLGLTVTSPAYACVNGSGSGGGC